MGKNAGEIRGCHENALAKSLETSPYMIKLTLSLKSRGGHPGLECTFQVRTYVFRKVST